MLIEGSRHNIGGWAVTPDRWDILISKNKWRFCSKPSPTIANAVIFNGCFAGENPKPRASNAAFMVSQSPCVASRCPARRPARWRWSPPSACTRKTCRWRWWVVWRGWHWRGSSGWCGSCREERGWRSAGPRQPEALTGGRQKKRRGTSMISHY